MTHCANVRTAKRHIAYNCCEDIYSEFQNLDYININNKFRSQQLSKRIYMDYNYIIKWNSDWFCQSVNGYTISLTHRRWQNHRISHSSSTKLPSAMIFAIFHLEISFETLMKSNRWCNLVCNIGNISQGFQVVLNSDVLPLPWIRGWYFFLLMRGMQRMFVMYGLRVI